MNKDQLIELLALSLAGLQVPISLNASLGSFILGTAEAPLREIMMLAPGWATAEEYEEIFTEIFEMRNESDKDFYILLGVITVVFFIGITAWTILT